MISFFPRSRVVVPEALQKNPFIEDAMDSIDDGNHPTALGFLGFLKRLREVVFQDAAELMLEGRVHFCFNHEAFKCPEFIQFKRQVEHHVTNSIDPQSATLDHVVPGLRNEMSSIRSDINSHFDRVHSNIQSVESNMVTKMTLQTIFNHIGNIDVLDTTATSTSSTTCQTTVSSADYSIFLNHKSTRSIWDEFYGINAFENDSYPEGIHKLERDYGHKWRRHFSSKQSKVISRMKYVIKFIKEKMQEIHHTETEENINDMINRIDQLLLGKKISSISGIEKYLKSGKIGMNLLSS